MSESRKGSKARENAPAGDADTKSALSRRIQRARSEAARFENPGDFVLVVGRDGTLLHQSPFFEEVFGVSTLSLVGRPVVDALSAAKTIASNEAIEIAYQLTSSPDAALRDLVCIPYLDRDDRSRVLEGRVYEAMRDPDTSVAIFRDATDRWEGLARVRTSERRYRRIAQASRDMVTETDSHGTFTYASDACLDVLGYEPEELVGTKALALHHEEDLPRFLEELREGRKSGGSFETSPHRLRHINGSWIWAEATGLVYVGSDGRRHTIGVARDITAQIEAEQIRAELEANMLRTQKLESLGILAAGVAHDFNNLLTPIVGNSAIVLADLPEDSPLRKRVEMIRMAANRATELTGQMLAYAGEGAMRIVPVNVSQSVREMRLLLESKATRAAELQFDLAGSLPMIEVDPAHIGQVVMNLVANASDSLPMSGGSITVRSGVMDAGRDYFASCTIGRECAPGRYVYIEVCDDGLGIEPVNRARIFDPFFTTRFTGRGLGLAAVHGIVRSYDGALELESAPCEGTRLRVLFPEASAAGITEAARAPAEPSRWPPRITGERRGEVLIVDHDEPARDLVESVLTRAGYETTCASNGPSATEIFRSRPDDFVGVILDCTMPGMGGVEIFECLREIRIGTPIILVSGDSRDRTAKEPLAQDHSSFLQKPFEIEDLMHEASRLFEPLEADGG